MTRKTDQRTPLGNGEDLLQQAKQTTSEVVDQVQTTSRFEISSSKKDEAAGL